jgi:DNA polymerase-3 subunit alpha
MSEGFVNQFKPIKINMHGVRLPEFKVEENKTNIDNLSFLKSLCFEGYEKKLLSREVDPAKAEEYTERTKHELDTLDDLGFVDYVLLVWDVINFCSKNDIPVGLGRGSAAGSLVLYLIGVTKIDPIKYSLFFERFISKTRAKKQIVDGVTYLDGSLMCDVDIDVCYYNRSKVLDYLETKFKGKTSKILTLNTLSGKLLMKECGKIVGGKDESEMNTVSSFIPKVFGKVRDIEEAREESDDFNIWCSQNENVYEIALKLRNLIKNKGSHPSGVLLSYDNIEESCPTELTSDKDPVSSFDMNWVSLFNVKLDILGLRSVSVVDNACKEIGIDVKDINLDDPFIYQQLQDLRAPHGLFQIEADTNFRVCQKVKPRNLEELSAVLALGRPGALAFVDQYANYTNNSVSEPIHPLFDDILSTTGGVCLYQEQMMRMANKVGFTLDESEILRRIVGKKKTKEVRQWKKKIREKVKENRLSDEWTGHKGNVDVGDVLWKVLEDSANYSFNKSHSIAYASLSAATIYLKFKHPKEFFLSLLKMTRHEPDPIKEISKIERELSFFDFKLLAPHIVKSKLDFSIEGNNIRFGLLSIKGISDKSIDRLNNFKNDYANKFEIFQAASEAILNIGTLCALIQAGALEGFKQSRTKVVYEAQLWNILTQKEKQLCMKYADKGDYDLVALLKSLDGKKDEKGKPLIRESRMGTIKKRCAPYKDIYVQNKKSESFANWYYEKHLLGYTHGRTLKDIFENKRSGLMSVREIEEAALQTKVAFVGAVDEKPYSGSSKKGNKYCRLSISDETGFIKVLIFKAKLEQCRVSNNGLPQEKNIVIVKGTKVDEAVFADQISVQTNKIFTKLSDLKAENGLT